MADFERFRSFVAVYRAGTVSAGAEARFLTQPAVSQHVAALEAETGHKLFKRMPRRMVPTEYGKKLYAQVAQAVDKLEQVAQQRRGTLEVDMPLVRLGAPTEYFHEILLKSLEGASLRFWLTFGVTAELLENLERRELDLVVATQRLPSPGVEFEKLSNERFMLVGSPDHETPTTVMDDQGDCQEKTVRIEEWLKEQHWVVYGTELPIVRRFWQQSFGGRPEIQPSLVIPDLRIILEAVELGQGIAMLPDYLCQSALKSGRISVLWEPTEPIENELWLAYRKTDQTDEDLKKSRELLKSAASTSLC
jgi:DNA-binding transcriptional LysR family regulator